ncbi:hypothetical protein ABC977_13185 [Thioalkalicoccus limnaeus]|uniref:Carboxypeptidase regulatory-like domain-containing protein n=1 Tax=Thioalkalicoccus limnaeus TaxID=120681 RepID=A0ABV4BFN6_9GAMM
MIVTANQRLETWIRTVLVGPAVSFAPPRDHPDEGTIWVHLLDLLPSPATSPSPHPPLCLSVRYLLTVWGQSPAVEHQLLGDLVVAALQCTDFDVELGPIEATLWQAFGLPPRPGFTVRLRVEVERRTPATPRIRELAKVREIAVTALSGRVLGTGAIPLSGAEVAVPALRLATRTDHGGWFRFASLPTGLASGSLRVRARGLERTVPLASLSGHAAPLVIHFDIEEG